MKCEAKLYKPYAKGPYNKSDDKEQWLRLSEGCPNKCLFCRESYENPELEVFDVSELIRNEVKIMDMNLLCHPEALDIIQELGRRKVNGKVVYYELICGIDYRFLTQEIASALKQARFKHIRLAWDFSFSYQIKIKDAVKLLLNAGYAPRDIMIFMICNWSVSYQDNLRKMELCKVWNLKISDCYFDNQVSPNIKPAHWTQEQIVSFRHKVRKHNQLVGFGIDPEPEKDIDF